MTSTKTSAEHREKVSLWSFRVGLLADFNGVSLLPCILDCRFCTGLPLRVFKHPVVDSTRWQSQLAPFSTHLLGYLNALTYDSMASLILARALAFGHAQIIAQSHKKDNLDSVDLTPSGFPPSRE